MRSSSSWLGKIFVTLFCGGLFLIIFFGLQVNMAHAASWYNPSWHLRQQIAINPTLCRWGEQKMNQLPGSHLSFWSLEHKNQRCRYSLYRCDDGVTLLPREIESYASGTLVAWVNVPTVSHTAASTSIYMYYSNATATEPAASDTYGSQAVWSNGYAGVALR